MNSKNVDIPIFLIFGFEARTMIWSIILFTSISLKQLQIYQDRKKFQLLVFLKADHQTISNLSDLEEYCKFVICKNILDVGEINFF